MAQNVILYGTSICPMVPPVRAMLERARVPYQYVNISDDAEARARVREINNGNESVPTLVFPDGTTLTEPASVMLRDKLQALGYVVPEATLAQRFQDTLQSPLIIMLIALALLFGLALHTTSLLVIGGIIAVAAVIARVWGRRKRSAGG